MTHVVAITRYALRLAALAGLATLFLPPPAHATPSVNAAVIAARETIQSFASPVPSPTVTCAAHSTALIVRWEITSPAVYQRRYQGVIWPGGASGPTWAVGYDGGHQTRQTITADWATHPQVTSLSMTSGVTGPTAKLLLPQLAHVRTPYPMAVQAFSQASLPSYRAAARRALGAQPFDALPCGAQAALDSLGYNRGWQMTGPRRAEMRAIRDICVPARDTHCIATQLRAMKRLWPDVKGLRDRRDDEAAYAERTI